MTLKDEAKNVAAQSRWGKLGLLMGCVALVVALFAFGKPDEAKQMINFAVELSQVSGTQVVSGTNP